MQAQLSHSSADEDQVTKSTVRRIEQMIQAGELPMGSMLPPQRILSERLSVGRSSLREALSILEALGVVQTKARLGTFVREVREDDPRPEWRLKKLYSPEEVYQFRIACEGQAAKLAAINSSNELIGELHKSSDAMLGAARDGDLLEFTEQDFAFHNLIMSASENRLFIDLHAHYNDVFRESQRMPLAWHRCFWEPVAEHKNVIRAIEKRDPENAAYFMRVHLMRGADRFGLKLAESL